jgi:SAM-dependent methyltransferase
MVLSAAEAAQQRAFQRWLGVSTIGNVYHQDGVAKSGQVFYTGSQWVPVRRALQRLGPGPTDVFVDLGAGKGQALLIAALLPYGRVIGVEVDEELSRTASLNVGKARSRLRTPAVEVVRADALAWPVPDDASIIFMYCPFVGELFYRVLERVFESYDRSPRHLFIVYSFPFEHNWLLSTGRVEVENVLPARWPTRPGWWKNNWVIVTYRVVPRSRSDEPGRAEGVFTAAAQRWSAQNDHRFWVGEPGRKRVYSDCHT